MHFRQFHPNVRIRILMNFATSIIFNMVIPFMSVYFAARLGSTVTGVALSGGVVLSLLSGFYGGHLSDRIGRKKIMVGAEIVWTATFLIMALANSPWFESAWVTFAMVLVINFCWGVYGPASDAMLLDVTTPANRKFMYSMFYWTNNLSIAIGGMLGALLFKHYLFELFLALGAVTAASLIVTWLFIGETYEPKRRDEPNEPNGLRGVLRSYREVAKDSTYLMYVAASMLIVSTEFHLSNYIGVRLEQQLDDYGLTLLGVLRTENTLLVVVFSLFVGYLMKRMKDAHQLFGGFLLYVTGYAVIAYSSNAWVLVVMMVIATWGEVMYVPVKQSYLGDLAPDDKRSAYLAVYSVSHQGASLIAAFAITLGGWLSPGVMGWLVFGSGMAGVLMFRIIMARLDARKRAEVPSDSVGA